MLRLMAVLAMTASLGRVQGSLRFRSISAGIDHSCALTTDGEVYCWGANDFYQLGSGARGSTSVPLRVGTTR